MFDEAPGSTAFADSSGNGFTLSGLKGAQTGASYLLTVTTAGEGTVSVPGTDCNGGYPSGSVVTLTAAPAAGWELASWGGACSGTPPSDTTCDLAMTEDQTASATFVPLCNLTVTKEGVGTVTSAPGGIDCGTDCSQGYSCGTAVTLTANADWQFGGWGGDCAGTPAADTTCELSMTENQSVSATFISPTLGEALNNTALVWTTHGDAEWFAQTSTSHDGEAAAQSGDIGDSQSSHLETTVAGPGTLSFYWKVSSENG